MQNTYIVASKTGKKRHFSSKTAKKLKKSPVFGENWANLAILMGFLTGIVRILQKMQKSPFLAKSLLKLFEFYSNRGRVISDRHLAYETKNRTPGDGRRF